MSDAHDKVVVIVEETVQRVFLVDPSEVAAIRTIQAFATREIVEGIPSFLDRPSPHLGKRASKAPLYPSSFLRPWVEDSAYRTLASVTCIIPDETGKHVLEEKFWRTATGPRYESKAVK